MLLPPTLDDRTLEHLLVEARRQADPDAQMTVDARGVTFVDPHGLLGLLEFGRLCDRLDCKVRLEIPASPEVRSYLHRMDFFEVARRFFLFETPEPPEAAARGTASDVLLEITPILQSKDIHTIVGRVRERAGAMLEKHLNYDADARDRFLVALSEICQNIVEHSEDRGFVAIQKYFYRERLGKNVVKIAVTDLGVGVRQSLGQRLAGQYGAKWSDATAIRQALFHAQSRFDDPGRGHGLRGVRTLTEQWGGRFVIRSGSAQLGIIPVWGRGRSEERGLPAFPGTQVWLTLPEAGPSPASRSPSPAKP